MCVRQRVSKHSIAEFHGQTGKKLESLSKNEQRIIKPQAGRDKPRPTHDAILSRGQAQRRSANANRCGVCAPKRAK